MKKDRLTKEEREILESYERGEWKSTSSMDKDVQRYAKYAKNSIKKNLRVSIRMSKQDLIGIQMKAANEGIPYQTLITSIIHKYLNGSLVNQS